MALQRGRGAALILLFAAAGCLAVGLPGPRDLAPSPAGLPAVPGGAGRERALPVSALAGAAGSEREDPRSAGRPSGVPLAVAAPRANAAGTAVPPVLLSIPSIGLAISVLPIGLNPDGTVEVPSNFQAAGWYRLGISPGQMGSAVILGHVDSYKGPAAFFRLRSLRTGDPVEVTLADRTVVHFIVNSETTYPKDQFPSQLVYGSQGFSALNLVTCGGDFDPHVRSYLSNVVVSTSLVGTTPPA
ncbi:MAG: hypothetical protein NVSMB32_04810 [Actinomycetota bacterium]